MRTLLLFSLGFLSLSVLAPARADDSRRFFDFTPISVENPVVATIDDTIKIPLSELRVYRDTERIQAITDPASLTQKRALLEDLINEYLYVDDAHRTGVTQSTGFLRQMEATRTMILTDFMAMRAANKKIAAPVGKNDAGAALADQLFEAASIDISNEAYALLQRAAGAVDKTSAASKQGPLVDSKQEAAAKLRAIVNTTPEAVLARYENKSISVHQLLVIYAGLPGPRPNLQTHEGLLGMIKPLIVPELMAIEAVKQGVAADPAFQNKLLQNRNALLRFHMQGLVEREANALINAPDAEAQLHAWYDQHPADYATPKEHGAQHILPFAEVRQRVEGDYSLALRDRLLAEKAQALRKTRSVKIDETALNAL